jgi:hypothetical protein
MEGTTVDWRDVWKKQIADELYAFIERRPLK